MSKKRKISFPAAVLAAALLTIASSASLAAWNYSQDSKLEASAPMPTSAIPAVAALTGDQLDKADTASPEGTPKLDISSDGNYNKKDADPFSDVTPEPYTYVGLTDIDCTSKPGSGYVVETLTTGSIVNAVGIQDGYAVLKLTSRGYAYAPANLFMKGENYATIDGAVDLRIVLQHAIYDMDFTTKNNITGRSLYPAIPLLETTTALRLQKADELFYKYGYIMVVHDAYRPITAQYSIWEAVPETTYVVNPYITPSWHNVGKAVDISLINAATEEPVELPTEIYTFTPASFRNNSDSWSQKARENVQMMTDIMAQAGFDSIESEWWHYEMKNDKGLPNMNQILNYAEIVFEPAS